MNRQLSLRAFLTVVIIAILTAIAFGHFIPGCGVEPKPHVVVDIPPTTTGPGTSTGTAPVKCGDLSAGDTRSASCPVGQVGDRIEVCKADGTIGDAVNTCKPQSPNCDRSTKTTFLEVRPIIAAKCLGCHFTPRRYDDYAVAKGLSDQIIRRINLSSDNPQRMPKSPNPELPASEKAIIGRWIDDGKLENHDCGGSGTDQAFLNFDYLESAALVDANRIDSDDRRFTRWLSATNRVNGGATASDLERARQAVDKGVNGLSSDRTLSPSAPVDAKGVVYRIDLRSYGLTPDDWKLIEDFDKLDIESFTTKGLLLKGLAKTRSPIMPFDDFLDTTYRNSRLYYALLRIPMTFDAFMRQLGIDFAGDLLPDANGRVDALAAGFNGSRISNSKNRLTIRHESKNDDIKYVWNTQDPVAIDGVAQRNLFQFPLPKETGSKKVFQFAAGETIAGLPNGLQQYALFNAAGIRQDVAPVNIVRDTDSPLSSEIRNANSCLRCHNGGLIPALDQVRASVIANAAQFDVKDVEIVKALYRPNDATAAQFNADIARYAGALTELGIQPGTPDPISLETDIYLHDWTAKQVSDYLWLTTQEFTECINGSARGRDQIGQLLNGNGTITYDQFVEVLPILKQDCRLFQDAIGQ